MAKLMVSEVYDALLDAGTSEYKARAAAEAVASYENKFHSMDITLKLHTAMLVFLIAAVSTLLWKVFDLTVKVVEIASKVSSQ